MLADDNFDVDLILLKKLSLNKYLHKCDNNLYYDYPKFMENDDKSHRNAFIQAEENLKNDLKMNTMFMSYISKMTFKP